MRIKQILKVLTLAFILSMPFSYNAVAATNPTETPTDKAKNDELAAYVVKRVTEIDNMDKTNLTTSEKKELKKELKDLKKKAAGLDQRVYLSVGAIIIIILLLILIL